MEGFNKEIEEDYLYLEYFVENDKPESSVVFRIIGEYDKKYKDNKFHYEYCEGLMINLGIILQSENILNCAIDRLLKKKDKVLKDKYYYDLANAIVVKADLKYKPGDLEYLLSAKAYFEASKYFSRVTTSDEDNFLRAKTNYSNILEKYGRNYEAIYGYDSALKIDNYFGMAKANKAIALEYYVRLCPQKSLFLLKNIKDLFSEAIIDKRVEDIGGEECIRYYKQRKEVIENYLKKEQYDDINRELPEDTTNYQKFILENDMYLNYDFGIYYDGSSFKDSFFPELIENINDRKSKKTGFMSEKTFYTFKIFNQIIEDYTSCRYLYYLCADGEYDSIDKGVNYIYLYDYTRHTTQNGFRKNIISTLYNCLDKLAHLIKYYFVDNEIVLDENIYFDWLVSSEFKEVIENKKNYQLLALYSLAMDFQDGNIYSKIRYIRNRITHSFITVCTDRFHEEDIEEFEISEEVLDEYAKKLLLLVKAAIFYTIISINNYKDENELYGKMFGVFEDEIYGI